MMEMIDEYDETVDFLVNELEQKKDELYVFKNKATKLEKYSKNSDEYIDKLVADITNLKKQIAYVQNEKSKTKPINKKGMIAFKENLNNKKKAVQSEMTDERKKKLTAADDKILDEMEKRRIEKILSVSQMEAAYTGNYKYLGEQIRNMNEQEIRHLAEVAEQDRLKVKSKR